MQNSLKIDTVFKLDKVFNLHNWNKDDYNERGMFNRAGKLFEMLDSKEQEVFILILENMTYYSIESYEQLLEECLLQLLNDERKKSHYYFAPILPHWNHAEIRDIKDKEGIINIENKIFDVKSSMLVTYLIKSNTLQYNKDISEMKMTTSYYYSQEVIDAINRKEVVLVLIDDFIGSGDTALESIEYFINRGVEKEKIRVLSLVTGQQGYEKIKSENIKIFTGSIVQSFIDIMKDMGMKEEEILEIKEIIASISNKLRIERDYFGYNNSFSLVSMIRTPNNAPSFLWNNKNKNVSDKIVFPRL